MKKYIIFSLLDSFFIFGFIKLFNEIKTDTFWLIGMISIILFLTVLTIISFKKRY